MGVESEFKEALSKVKPQLLEEHQVQPLKCASACVLSKLSEWELREEALDYKKIAETLNGPGMEPVK